MGTKEDRLESAILAFAAAKDIPCRIDTWGEPRIPQQLHCIFSSLNVGIGVGDAADSISKCSSDGTPEEAEFLECSL